jgi:hypothetical protein
MDSGLNLVKVEVKNLTSNAVETHSIGVTVCEVGHDFFKFETLARRKFSKLDHLYVVLTIDQSRFVSTARVSQLIRDDEDRECVVAHFLEYAPSEWGKILSLLQGRQMLITKFLHAARGLSVTS